MLDVAAADADGVDALGTNTRVSGLATKLKLSLLAVVRAASTRRRPLVAAVPSETHVDDA